MAGLTTTYLMAFGAMTFSALSALMLIFTLSRLDPAEKTTAPQSSATVAA